MEEDKEGRASILIVEDDQNLCKTLELILEKKGFDAETAGTGQQALEKAQERFFNVVLLDLNLPDKSGVDLILPLKEIHPEMEVIVITGLATLDTAVKALNEGATAYVTKPLDMDDILGRVREFVEKQHLLFENQRLFEEAQREIEERKQAEEALRAREEQFRIVINSIPALIAYVDSTRVYRFVNSTYSDWFGRPDEEIIGKNVWDVHGQEAYERLRNPINRVLSGEEVTFDTEISGTPRGNRWLTGILTPNFQEDGQVKGYFVITTDITERKRAEEALRESRELERQAHARLIDAIESLPGSFAIYDAEDRFVLSNSKTFEIFPDHAPILKPGTSYEDIIRTSMEKGLIQVDTGEPEAYIRKRLQEFREKPEVIEQHWADGRWFAIYHRPTSDGGTVTFRLDTTERKQLEVQFQQAQKMEAVGTLAGGIAHNFNNLLQVIMSNISLLLMETDSSPPQHEILSAIETSVSSGAELTKQLLGFARGGKYQAEPTNLSTLLLRTAYIFGSAHMEISIHKKLETELWIAKVDQSQIEQVLLNLFVNAWQAMPHGGQLFLKSENVTLEESFPKPHDTAPGRYVKLSVTDTGVGMDQEILGRIFEPFFTTKEMARGSGLGLASAYGIIKNHEGIITVDSEVGKGTTFDIYLPATEEEMVEIKETIKEKRKGTGTILFVDDDKQLVETERRLLRMHGYDVLVANSGDEALGIYEKNKDKIDLVILDMIMPQMGGGETFDKLRALEPNVKVLLSSGYSLEGEAAEIMERGCDAFIQKPFDLDTLFEQIHGLLGQE